MRRTIQQYSGSSPEAIACGSKAQMMYFVEDAKADIASLAEQLDEATLHAVTLEGFVAGLEKELAEERARLTRLESELAEARGQRNNAAFGFEQELALKKELAGALRDAQAENARLLTDNANAMRALKPLADVLTNAEKYSSDPERLLEECRDQLTLYEFQQARAALAGHEQAAPTMTAEQMRAECDFIVCNEWQAFARVRGVPPSAMIAAILNAIRSIPASPGKGAE